MKTIVSHGKWQTQKNFGLTWHIKKNVYSLLMVQPCLTDFVFSPCVVPPSIVVCSVQCVLVLTLLQLQQSAIEKSIKIYPKTNFWAGQDISQKVFFVQKNCISVLWEVDLSNVSPSDAIENLLKVKLSEVLAWMWHEIGVSPSARHHKGFSSGPIQAP